MRTIEHKRNITYRIKESVNYIKKRTETNIEEYLTEAQILG